jgi:hypothetical protein
MLASETNNVSFSPHWVPPFLELDTANASPKEKEMSVRHSSSVMSTRLDTSLSSQTTVSNLSGFTSSLGFPTLLVSSSLSNTGYSEMDLSRFYAKQNEHDLFSARKVFIFIQKFLNLL